MQEVFSSRGNMISFNWILYLLSFCLEERERWLYSFRFQQHLWITYCGLVSRCQSYTREGNRQRSLPLLPVGQTENKQNITLKHRWYRVLETGTCYGKTRAGEEALGACRWILILNGFSIERLGPGGEGVIMARLKDKYTLKTVQGVQLETAIQTGVS